MLERIQFLLTYMKMDLRWWVYRNFYSKKKFGLSTKELQLLDELHKNGIVAIPDYMSKEECDQLENKMQEYVGIGEDTNFDSGAYIRFKRAREYDNGVVRVYKADLENEQIAKFRNDESVQRVVNAYFGFPMYSLFSSYQHNKAGLGDTRSFHVDSWTREFKSFVYLTDVEEDHGPFTYLKGSHKAYWKRYQRILTDNGRDSSTSYTPEQCGSWMKNFTYMTAKAGTLILCDVNGLHRGSPQKDKTRSVLYNAFVYTSGDASPEY